MLRDLSRPLLLALFLMLPACGRGDVSSEAYRQAVRTRVESNAMQYAAATGGLRAAVEHFYEQNGYAPAWAGTEALRPPGRALIEHLRGAEDRGLAYAGYGLDRLERALEAAYEENPDTPDVLAELDVLLSFAFMRRALDLHAGRVDPAAIDSSWHPRRDSLDLAAVQQEALGGALEERLLGLAPRHDGFQKLQEATARYAQIAEEGGWPAVPGGEALRVGDRSERVPVLRKRLAATGDFAPPDTTGDPRRVLGEALAGALARFQERHGLAADSVLDAATLKALNVPAEDRLHTLQLNLERWRWLPVQRSARYIVVNVPAFRLYAYAGGERVEDMAVVVGGTYGDRATPLFADQMEYLVFNPYWNIPPGIAAEEIVPQAEDDLDYLAQNDYEIVGTYAPDAEVYKPSQENLGKVAAGELRLRQENSPQNALGDVKFMFPNEHAVYLHDTPAQHLFDREERAFSHGCIRVEHPAALAAYALRNTSGWDRSRIERTMQGADRERVDLAEPLPVYILYRTAYVDEETGAVHFRDDLYGHDAALAEVLALS